MLPAAIEMASIIWGKKIADQQSLMLVSENRVSCRIADLAGDVKKQIKVVRCSPFFTLQVDKSTDFANEAQMMVFIRYIYSSQIKETLFCHSVPTRTTAEELFKILDQYMTDKNI